MDKFNSIDVYPVLCGPLSKGRSDAEVCRACLEGGARIIQYRNKTGSLHEMTTIGKEIRAMTRAAGALLIINDSLPLALAIEADGVHLGQSDMPAAEARKAAPDMIIGVSTHNIPEACKAAEDGADYINIGPVFPTATKENLFFLGIPLLKDIAARAELPFTVMGGINRTNINQVLAAGARRIAMVSAVVGADDIAAEVQYFKTLILSNSAADKNKKKIDSKNS